MGFIGASANVLPPEKISGLIEEKEGGDCTLFSEFKRFYLYAYLSNGLYRYAQQPVLCHIARYHSLAVTQNIFLRI